jgi:hypothetical protein
MRLTPSVKLSMYAVIITVLLFLTGPMLIAFTWQSIHGRDVTVNGLTLHLERGWMVLHNSIVRVPDDLFFRDADDNFISVTPLPHRPPPESSQYAITKLRSFMEETYSQPTRMTTVRIGETTVSCFEMRPLTSSQTNDTTCIAPSGQRVISIRWEGSNRSEAITCSNPHMKPNPASRNLVPE